MMKVVASWSGGKDSCLAHYQAVNQGLEVAYLLNFMNKNSHKSMSHGLDSRLMSLQAEAMGISLVQREVTWETYEEEFKAVMRELMGRGVEGGVFGDIELQEHKDWLDRVCGEVGLQPMLPLWGKKPEEILSTFVGTGFEAVIVAVKAELMSKEWLGCRIDNNSIEGLNNLAIHPCGEAGEYHTFVTSGPTFKKSIKALAGEYVFRDGYWFWDITGWELD